MYNAKIEMELLKVNPYSKEKEDERIEGVMVTGKVELKDRQFFNDIDFSGKEMGGSRILQGEIPVKEPFVSLQFVKKQDLTLEFGGEKNVPVDVVDLATGAIVDKKIFVLITLNIKTLKKEIAGELVSKLKDFVTIKLKTAQEEMFPAQNNKITPISNN